MEKNETQASTCDLLPGVYIDVGMFIILLFLTMQTFEM